LWIRGKRDGEGSGVSRGGSDEHQARLVFAIDIQVKGDGGGLLAEVETDAVDPLIGLKVERYFGFARHIQRPVVLERTILLQLVRVDRLKGTTRDNDAAAEAVLDLGGRGAEVPAVFVVPDGKALGQALLEPLRLTVGIDLAAALGLGANPQ